MNKRINLGQAEPAAMQAMLTFNNYLQTTQLTHQHQELIKIRASQLNGCAYCLNMHTKDALKYGEKAQRIYVLSAWRETDFFSEQEQAILALTEEMTVISKAGVSEETYQKASRLFDESYLTQIIMAIVIINGWNRIAVATHMKPALD